MTNTVVLAPSLGVVRVFFILVGGYFKKKDRLKRTESFDVSLVNQSESVDRSIPSF